MTTAVLSAMIRPLVEPRLPDWVDAHWFASKEEALALAPSAEIGWFDFAQHAPMNEVVTAATNLKWLNSIYAGLDFLPLDLLHALYGFTRSEAAVAEALLAGHTAEQIAAMRQVGVPTIRSQIRAILDKTGARTIRDLGRFIQAP